MMGQRFNSVWDAIEDMPQEAASMQFRADLMKALVGRIGSMTRAKAANLLGVTQPRISDLMRGKIDLFSIDTLVNMLATAEINRRNKRGKTGMNVVGLAVSTAVAAARASEKRRAGGPPAVRTVTKKMAGAERGRG